MALLTFGSSALHLKPRDRFLNWSARQVRERRHLIEQKQPLPDVADGGPVAQPGFARAQAGVRTTGAGLAEPLPDTPCAWSKRSSIRNGFAGTCYRAANWQVLGQTLGFERCRQDYLDTQHLKELWALSAASRGTAATACPACWRRRSEGRPSPATPGAGADGAHEFAGPFPAPTRPRPAIRMGCVIPSLALSVATLAVAAGCQGPHAIAEFARASTTASAAAWVPSQAGSRRQFQVPCERTYRRLLEAIDPDQLRRSYSDWTATLETEPV